MTHARQFITAATTLLLGTGVLAVAPTLAQEPAGASKPTFAYGTETRLSGMVEDVRIVSSHMGTPLRHRHDAEASPVSGHMAMEEAYVLMSVGGETIEVYLGPPAFLRDKNVEIIPGEMLEVVGWKTTLDGSEVMLAREVQNWEAVRWTFRDTDGRPLWASREPH